MAITTQADIEARYGAQAVINWTDHDELNIVDTTNLNWGISAGESDLNFALGQRYDTSSAEYIAHPLVLTWATIFSAWYLSTTRGNPAPMDLHEEMTRIREFLERILKGEISITDLPLKADLRPTMSNRQVDRRYRRRTVRVDRESSTDAPTKLRRNLTQDYGDYFI